MNDLQWRRTINNNSRPTCCVVHTAIHSSVPSTSARTPLRRQTQEDGAAGCWDWSSRPRIIIRAASADDTPSPCPGPAVDAWLVTERPTSSGTEVTFGCGGRRDGRGGDEWLRRLLGNCVLASFRLSPSLLYSVKQRIRDITLPLEIFSPDITPPPEKIWSWH